MSPSIALCVLSAVLVVALPHVSGHEGRRFNFTTARIADIRSAIRQRQITCRDIICGYQGRIDKYGFTKSTGAIIKVNPDALKEAEALDKAFEKSGKLKGRLHCIPLVVKDSIDVAGLPTTNGLNAFKDQIPKKDSTVVKNVKAQGAIIIAKANMSPLSDKEAWGNSETGGQIHNPFGLEYTTYGSSGGSAAAATAMLAVGAIGTETGVSINMPSSANGVVGFRPPVDLLKACNCRDGVMPNSEFQDVVGPIARSAEDAITIFDGMIGKEGEYSSTVMNPRGLANMSINVWELMSYGTFPLSATSVYVVDSKIKQLMASASSNMEKAGANVKNVSIDFGAAAPSILGMFGIEYSSCIPAWRNTYFGDTTRFGSEKLNSVKEVVDSKKLPEYYQKIWEGQVTQSAVAGQCDKETKAFKDAVAALIKNAITPVLAGADVAVWPALPSFPAKMGTDAAKKEWGSSTQSPINLILLASWAGYPSVTVPLGYSDKTKELPQGLPVGLFMISEPSKFPQLLKAAYAIQEHDITGTQQFPANFISGKACSDGWAAGGPDGKGPDGRGCPPPPPPPPGHPGK